MESQFDDINKSKDIAFETELKVDRVLNVNLEDDKGEIERNLALEAQANYMTYVIIIFSCLGAAMFGIDQGNFGNLQGFIGFQRHWCVGQYGDELTCTGAAAPENAKWQHSFILWGGSLITFGAAFGALLLAPFLASYFGRRLCISTGCTITVFGCIITAFLSFSNVSAFMFGRFMTGFGVGVACYALPMYSAELSPPKIRGSTGALFQLNVVLGSFISTVITLKMHDWQWAIMLPAFPGLIVAVGIWFCPESPRYLTKQNREDEAIQALKGIRKGDVLPEAHAISRAIQEENSRTKVSYISLLENKSVRKRVFIASAMQICQQLTGINVFLTYANTIYTKIGMTDPLETSVIQNAVMVAAIVIGLLLLDRKEWFAGRKVQLLISSIIMTPALLIGGLAVLQSWSGALIVTTILSHAFGFQVGWGPIAWIYSSEIFENEYREKAMSIAVFFQYISNAGVVVATPYMLTWSTGGSILLLFGTNFINLVFVLIFVVETKNVLLEDIPKLFDTKQSFGLSLKFLKEKNTK